MIILLLTITIIYYHYAKQTDINAQTIQKMENNEFIKVPIKNCLCNYFNNTFKLEYFDFDILMDHIKL